MRRDIAITVAIFFAIPMFFLAFSPFVRQRKLHWLEEQGSTMGSTYRLLVAVPDNGLSIDREADLLKAAQRYLVETESLLSTWRTDSQLSLFNSQSTTEWFPVDARTVELVELAAELNAVDRRFDISVVPLSELWGFGPGGHVDEEPSQAAIEECLQHVGMDKLDYRREPPALRKKDPALRIDLSALVAGYVADYLAKDWFAIGLKDCYIDIAGEIRVGGRNRDGKMWTIGIAEPKAGSLAIQTRQQLTNLGIATSGNYRKYNSINGRQFGHIIDPISGRPSVTDTLSATVIDRSCARADGIATLMMTMPSNEALDMANRHGWYVRLLVSAGEGKIEERRSVKQTE